MPGVIGARATACCRGRTSARLGSIVVRVKKNMSTSEENRTTFLAAIRIMNVDMPIWYVISIAWRPVTRWN